MAKSLQERIASALSTDRVTLTELTELIPLAEAERERLRKAHAQASAESIDFALSEADRDEAAKKAERYGRNVAGLSTAIAQLKDKLEARRQNESFKAAEAEKAAALAERDDLAELFREIVPAAVEQLVTLFAAVQANAERMRVLRLFKPDAEAIARGLAGFLDRAGEPDRFLTMKVPNFSGVGRCWPPEQRIDIDLGREYRLASLERMREEQARWQRHIVTPPEGNREPIEFRVRQGVARVSSSPVIALLSPECAEVVRKLGCKAEIAGPDVSIGMPSVGNF